MALDDFAGCAVVISHDRWFLDRVATHILAFEGDSQVTWFEGAYDEYEEHRRKLLGDEADAAPPDHVQAARPQLASTAALRMPIPWVRCSPAASPPSSPA